MPKKAAPKVSGRLADILVQKTQAKFDKESITINGQDAENLNYISTRCFALDAAIGRPGIPVGRLTVIQGREASGKTTIVTNILAECQARGGISVYLDTEDAFESGHAAAMGLYDAEEVERRNLDVEPLLLVYPTDIQDAFTKIEFLIKEVRAIAPDKLLCIAWDSVAATASSAEASDENESYDIIRPGLAAREVSQGLRRLTSIVARQRVALICVNQEKEKINSGFGGFGDNTATIAQKPLGFHASVRMKVAHAGYVPKGKTRAESHGITCVVNINKNKIAPPHRAAEFDILYATGIDNEGSMYKMAKTFNILKTKGGYTYYGEESFRQSAWPDVPFHDEVVEKVRAEVAKRAMDALGGKWGTEATSEDPDDDEDYAPIPKKKYKVEEEEDD